MAARAFLVRLVLVGPVVVLFNDAALSVDAWTPLRLAQTGTIKNTGWHRASRTAKPCTPVQFWSWPPSIKSITYTAFYLRLKSAGRQSNGIDGSSSSKKVSHSPPSVVGRPPKRPQQRSLSPIAVNLNQQP